VRAAKEAKRFQKYRGSAARAALEKSVCASYVQQQQQEQRLRQPLTQSPTTMAGRGVEPATQFDDRTMMSTRQATRRLVMSDTNLSLYL
jgi:hypothetical protein